jgi:hypothetical protein
LDTNVDISETSLHSKIKFKVLGLMIFFFSNFEGAMAPLNLQVKNLSFQWDSWLEDIRFWYNGEWSVCFYDLTCF